MHRFLTMRCFTEEELRRGLETAIQEWDRCAVCGTPNDDAHDNRPHAFQAVDVLDLFLKGASQKADVADR